MQLTSTAFEEYHPIPQRYTGEGEDLSPELRWSDVPVGTRSFALVCEDPDAPKRQPNDPPFVHWLIYDLSPNTSLLPEGVPKQPHVSAMPIEAEQGTNSFGKVGYGGPMPPKGHGMHRYHFRLFALDRDLSLKPGATARDLSKAIQGHVLAEATLIGRYERH